MRAVIVTYPNISHYKIVEKLANELIDQGNEVYCLIGKNYDRHYKKSDKIKYIYYSDEINKKGKAYKDEVDDILTELSLVDNRDSVKKYAVLFSKFIVKTCKLYTDEVLEEIKNINPDMIIRDCCAFYGKMIGEKLGVTTIGYITNLICTDEYITKSPVKNLSIAYNWDLGFMKDEEVLDLFNEINIEIKKMCTELDSPQLPLLFTLNPKEDINIVFTSKMLQPELKDNEKYKYIFSRPALYNDIEKNTEEFIKNKKLIYVSTGSQISAPEEFYNTIINTYADSEYEVVISCKYADEERLKDIIPKNIKIYSFVDQNKILEKASLFITHGGYNSVYESIFYNVPMLVYPLSNDQPLNANIVHDTGIGVNLKKFNFNSSNLKKLTKEIIDNEDIKHNLKIIKNDFYNSITLKELVNKLTI